MNRGDRREPIFKDEADRQRLVETLAEACAKTGWLHASLDSKLQIADSRQRQGQPMKNEKLKMTEAHAPSFCIFHFEFSVGAGDDPEFGSRHSGQSSGFPQRRPFGLMKMRGQTRPELRGEIVLVFAGGFGQNGFQPVHQFMLLCRRELFDRFQNFGDGAHAQERYFAGPGRPS